MSLAGSGKVAVTQTVRDLVSGGGLQFAESGTHELKGVPGTWTIFTLTEVDGDPVPAPMDEVESSSRREAFSVREPGVRRRTLVAAVAAVAIISSLTTAFLLDDDPALPPVATDRILSLDPSTGSVRPLPLDLPYTGGGIYPGLVVGEGGVWVSDSSLHHIDPVTGTEASLGDRATGAVTTGFEDVWVGTGQGLQRWDASDDELLREYPVPGPALFAPTGICSGFGSIWVTAVDGFLYRFDPDGGIPEKIRVGGLPRDVVATQGLIWVADEFGKVVLHVDPDTNEVSDDEIEIGAEPVSMAATMDSLWLVDPQGILTVVNIASGNSKSIPLEGAKPVDVVSGLGAVWVADLRGRRILRIDELLQEVSDSFSVPGAPAALAIDEETGLLWIRTIDSRRI
jgi:streptogramin lyase